MSRTVLILVVGLVTLAGCSTVPDHNDAWLSFKYSFSCGDFGSCSDMSDLTEATNYYRSLGIDPDHYYLFSFRSDNGFGAVPEAAAVYGNNGDLQIGREMHCAQTGQKIACYVKNWGPAPSNQVSSTWPDLTEALLEADGTITDTV